MTAGSSTVYWRFFFLFELGKQNFRHFDISEMKCAVPDPEVSTFNRELILIVLSLWGIQSGDAFRKEENAIGEEGDAQPLATSQEEMEDADEEEICELWFGDDSLPPAISIATGGGEVCQTVENSVRS